MFSSTTTTTTPPSPPPDIPTTSTTTPPPPPPSDDKHPPPLIIRHDIPAPHTGHIRILSLNRPAARNALSRALVAALAAELAACARAPALRAVVLSSAADGAFCAGADLVERATQTGRETARAVAALRAAVAAAAALPVPVVAAVAGAALGGGLELALAADLRVVAATGAVLGLPETRLGVIPGAGGIARLRALVGPAAARRLVLTGRRVEGREAWALGMVDELVEVGGAEGVGEARRRVLDVAVGLAREVCEGAPLAIRMALKVLRDPCEMTESKAYETVMRSRDRDEGLLAFAEKRRPVFEGR